VAGFLTGWSVFKLDFCPPPPLWGTHLLNKYRMDLKLPPAYRRQAREDKIHCPSLFNPPPAEASVPVGEGGYNL